MAPALGRRKMGTCSYRSYEKRRFIAPSSANFDRVARIRVVGQHEDVHLFFETRNFFFQRDFLPHLGHFGIVAGDQARFSSSSCGLE